MANEGEVTASPALIRAMSSDIPEEYLAEDVGEDGSNERTALLSSNGRSSVNHGATTQAARKLLRMSRFGPDAGSKGVKPSTGRMSAMHFADFLAEVPGPRQRKTITNDVGGVGNGSSGRQRAQSFLEMADGSLAAMTPLEMGRHELYEEVPFVAVPGLQKREHALSLAFSSYAAGLDIEETEEYLKATTGKGMNPNEREKRVSRLSMLMLDELETDGAGATVPLLGAVFIACLLAFNVGHNISVMNPSEAYAFPGHSTSLWSLAVAAFCVGGPFGAVLAGKWADEKGRCGALLQASWLFIAGGLVQALAPALSVMVIGRLIIGVASGATTVLVPIYLGELAPPNLRGVIGTMTQFSLVIGILFADLLGFLFGSETQWRYMFLTISALGACPLLFKALLLESPRWLLGTDPNSMEARVVIKQLRGFRYDEEIETEVDHYLGASSKQSSESDDGGKENVTKQLFADKSVRLLLVSSLVLQVSSQLSGINAVFYYSGLFFEGVIENPLVGTALMGAINVLATYLALLLMDRCGRRTLIMWSSGGMFVSCLLIVLSLLGYFEKTVALAAVALYVTFFELGLGPIPSLIVAEMFDGKYVTAAMSVSSQINWSANFLVGLLFPFMNKSLGPYSFGPFAVVLLGTFLYAWIWLPETQGTTPAELQLELAKKNAGVTYHNIDVEGMATHSRLTNLGGGDEWAAAMKAIEEEENGMA